MCWQHWDTRSRLGRFSMACILFVPFDPLSLLIRHMLDQNEVRVSFTSKRFKIRGCEDNSPRRNWREGLLSFRLVATIFAPLPSSPFPYQVLSNTGLFPPLLISLYQTTVKCTTLIRIQSICGKFILNLKDIEYRALIPRATPLVDYLVLFPKSFLLIIRLTNII